jgi:hypothetical protein
LKSNEELEADSTTEIDLGVEVLGVARARNGENRLS